MSIRYSAETLSSHEFSASNFLHDLVPQLGVPVSVRAVITALRTTPYLTRGLAWCLPLLRGASTTEAQTRFLLLAMAHKNAPRHHVPPTRLYQIYLLSDGTFSLAAAVLRHGPAVLDFWLAARAGSAMPLAGQVDYTAWCRARDYLAGRSTTLPWDVWASALPGCEPLVPENLELRLGACYGHRGAPDVLAMGALSQLYPEALALLQEEWTPHAPHMFRALTNNERPTDVLVRLRTDTTDGLHPFTWGLLTSDANTMLGLQAIVDGSRNSIHSLLLFALDAYVSRYCPWAPPYVRQLVNDMRELLTARGGIVTNSLRPDGDPTVENVCRWRARALCAIGQAMSSLRAPTRGGSAGLLELLNDYRPTENDELATLGLQWARQLQTREFAERQSAALTDVVGYAQLARAADPTADPMVDPTAGHMHAHAQEQPAGAEAVRRRMGALHEMLNNGILYSTTRAQPNPLYSSWMDAVRDGNSVNLNVTLPTEPAAVAMGRPTPAVDPGTPAGDTTQLTIVDDPAAATPVVLQNAWPSAAPNAAPGLDAYAIRGLNVPRMFAAPDYAAVETTIMRHMAEAFASPAMRAHVVDSHGALEGLVNAPAPVIAANIFNAPIATAAPTTASAQSYESFTDYIRSRRLEMSLERAREPINVPPGLAHLFEPLASETPAAPAPESQPQVSAVNMPQRTPRRRTPPTNDVPAPPLAHVRQRPRRHGQAVTQLQPEIPVETSAEASAEPDDDPATWTEPTAGTDPGMPLRDRLPELLTMLWEELRGSQRRDGTATGAIAVRWAMTGLAMLRRLPVGDFTSRALGDMLPAGAESWDAPFMERMRNELRELSQRGEGLLSARVAGIVAQLGAYPLFELAVQDDMNPWCCSLYRDTNISARFVVVDRQAVLLLGPRGQPRQFLNLDVDWEVYDTNQRTNSWSAVWDPVAAGHLLRLLSLEQSGHPSNYDITSLEPNLRAYDSRPRAVTALEPVPGCPDLFELGAYLVQRGVRHRVYCRADGLPVVLIPTNGSDWIVPTLTERLRMAEALRVAHPRTRENVRLGVRMLATTQRAEVAANERSVLGLQRVDPQASLQLHEPIVSATAAEAVPPPDLANESTQSVFMALLRRLRPTGNGVVIVAYGLTSRCVCLYDETQESAARALLSPTIQGADARAATVARNVIRLRSTLPSLPATSEVQRMAAEQLGRFPLLALAMARPTMNPDPANHNRRSWPLFRDADLTARIVRFGQHFLLLCGSTREPATPLDVPWVPYLNSQRDQRVELNAEWNARVDLNEHPQLAAPVLQTSQDEHSADPSAALLHHVNEPTNGAIAMQPRRVLGITPALWELPVTERIAGTGRRFRIFCGRGGEIMATGEPPLRATVPGEPDVLAQVAWLPPHVAAPMAERCRLAWWRRLEAATAAVPPVNPPAPADEAAPPAPAVGSLRLASGVSQPLNYADRRTQQRLVNLLHQFRPVDPAAVNIAVYGPTDVAYTFFAPYAWPPDAPRRMLDSEQPTEAERATFETVLRQLDQVAPGIYANTARELGQFPLYDLAWSRDVAAMGQFPQSWVLLQTQTLIARVVQLGPRFALLCGGTPRASVGAAVVSEEVPELPIPWDNYLARIVGERVSWYQHTDLTWMSGIDPGDREFVHRMPLGPQASGTIAAHMRDTDGTLPVLISGPDVTNMYEMPAATSQNGSSRRIISLSDGTPVATVALDVPNLTGAHVEWLSNAGSAQMAERLRLDWWGRRRAGAATARATERPTSAAVAPGIYTWPNGTRHVVTDPNVLQTPARSITMDEFRAAMDEAQALNRGELPTTTIREVLSDVSRADLQDALSLSLQAHAMAITASDDTTAAPVVDSVAHPAPATRPAQVVVNHVAAGELPVLLERLRLSIPAPYSYVAVTWAVDGTFAIRYYEMLDTFEELLGTLRPPRGLNTYALRYQGDAATFYAPASINRLEGAIRLTTEPYDAAPYTLDYCVDALATYPLDYLGDRDGFLVRTPDMSARMIRWSDPLSGYTALLVGHNPDPDTQYNCFSARPHDVAADMAAAARPHDGIMWDVNRLRGTLGFVPTLQQSICSRQRRTTQIVDLAHHIQTHDGGSPDAQAFAVGSHLYELPAHYFDAVGVAYRVFCTRTGRVSMAGRYNSSRPGARPVVVDFTPQRSRELTETLRTTYPDVVRYMPGAARYTSRNQDEARPSRAE